MIKKFFAFLLCTVLLWGTAVPVYASDKSTRLEDIPAESALLMEETTGEILFEKNAHAPMAPASITKIMTMLLVMEEIDKGNLSLNDKLTCSDYASHMGGSEIWLEVGEQMTVDDLLKAVFVGSANDASVVFAEHLAGSEDEFVKRMNAKADQLGLEHTQFVNCTGFDEEGHYACAYDIAQMARALMEYPMVQNYTTIWMDTLRGGKTELTNTNRLVRFYQGITGLKTGHTDNAGSCLCATAQRGSLKLISVVLKCPSSSVRNQWSQRLLDYGFANFEFCSPHPVDDQLTPIRVRKGTLDSAEIFAEYPDGVLMPKGSSTLMEQTVILAEDLTAPVERGQTVGRVEVFVGEQKVLEYPVKAKEAIPEMTFLKAMGRMMKSLVSLGG